LLLWAWQAGDIDWLLSGTQQQLRCIVMHAAANAGSATLLADIGS